MSRIELDSLIDQLIPQVLADRELGNGRTFTKLHFCRLWALSCLQAGECFDEHILADRVAQSLPPNVNMELEFGATHQFVA